MGKKMNFFLLCSDASNLQGHLLYPPYHPPSPCRQRWGRELITGGVVMSDSTSVVLVPIGVVSHRSTFSLPRIILPQVFSGTFNEHIFIHFKHLQLFTFTLSILPVFKYQLFQEVFYDLLQAGLWVFPLFK